MGSVDIAGIPLDLEGLNGSGRHYWGIDSGAIERGFDGLGKVQ